MTLFAVLFGLSTDYAVFLLSRIHEDYLRTADARGAVVSGVASTARVILATASVMVAVFAGFVLNGQRVVNLFGFGVATAIASYALLAMLALAPAVLTVLGRSAWWLPGRAAARRSVVKRICRSCRRGGASACSRPGHPGGYLADRPFIG